MWQAMQMVVSSLDGGTGDMAKDAIRMRCPIRVQVYELDGGGEGDEKNAHDPEQHPKGNGLPTTNAAGHEHAFTIYPQVWRNI
jgi:hypothetical protein